MSGITDVPGVRVGHRTLIDGDIRTGVTAIVPHDGNLFLDRPVAAADVLNGFGKTIGLMQLEELGQLETPILLTNTLSVGTCGTALIRRATAENPGIGRRQPTVNAVVGECNDGRLNDIQAMAVSEADALAALDAAGEDFARGSVGAGAGMVCFGFKGGIGSASRKIELDHTQYTLGVLVLANFGGAGDLVLPDGRRPHPGGRAMADQGSIMVIMATDVPLDHRQLKRVIRRGGAGLARLGSCWGHGSGDVMIGFTTANRVALAPASAILPQRVMAEDRIDLLFRAMVEATAESVLDALQSSSTTTGRGGSMRLGLNDVLETP
jgi:D-aminopeptidase